MSRNIFSAFILIMVLAAFSFLNSPMFKADSLSFSGNLYLSDEELDKLVLFKPKNVLRIDGGAIVDTLKNHPWIDNAKVKWSWPNVLDVIIEERQPFALVPVGESWYLLDEDGNLLPPPLGSQVYSLPLVTNIDVESNEQLESTARILTHVPKSLWKDVSEYNAAERSLITRSGSTILVGDSQDLTQKFALIEAIISDLALENKLAKKIDVRILRSPVVIVR